MTQPKSYDSREAPGQPYPLNHAIRRMSWAELDRHAATLTDADYAAADAFSVRVNRASDADMARWGIHSPALRQSVRTLFAGPWTPVAQ